MDVAAHIAVWCVTKLTDSLTRDVSCGTSGSTRGRHFKSIKPIQIAKWALSIQGAMDVKHRALFISVTIALAIGLIQTYFALLCWVYLAMHSPLVHWLFGMGLRGTAIRAVVYPVDLLTNVSISMPAALALAKLRPGRTWLYLIVAVIPSFVLLNWNLVGESYGGQFPGEMAWGWLQELVALPIATWLATALWRPKARAYPHG